MDAKRVVKFKGREGEGLLSLIVTHRTPNIASFTVLSDTSPIAQWVAHQSIHYQVEPAGQHTQLTVSIQYERKLAPAWFFKPVMKGAMAMAMNVLARDVKLQRIIQRWSAQQLVIKRHITVNGDW